MPYNLTSLEKEQIESAMNSLAYKLAVNWINASLPRDSGNEERGKLLNVDAVRFASPHQAFRGERFIAIVGAGASAEAAGLKLGGESSSIIEKRYTDLAKTPDSKAAEELLKLIKREKEQAQIVFRLDENDFETKLYYLSQIFDIHDSIVELLGHRHAVSLNYELLAHLFRHRFLDVIINFNFDEILDEAIEQESGKGNYTRIISDGECPDDFNEQVYLRKLKRPVYIKPHGTYSHRSTLRFTREAYYEVPPQIQGFMQKLLAGTIVDIKKEESPDRLEACEQVNLLILGFGMQSLEMNRILSRLYSPAGSNIARNTRLNIYYFDVLGSKTYEEKLDELQRKFYIGSYANQTPVEKDPIKAESLHFIPIDPTDKQLNQGGHLLSIYNRILNQFRRFYRPSPITRHQIMHTIFERSTPLPADSPAMLTYFRDQMLINLAIYAGRNKYGLLGINQLYSNRIATYFTRYKELRRRLTENSTEDIVPGCNFSRYESLVDLFQALGLKEHGYGQNVWRMAEDISECADFYLSDEDRKNKNNWDEERLKNQFWQYFEQLDSTFSVSVFSLYNGKAPLHFHNIMNKDFADKLKKFTVISSEMASKNNNTSGWHYRQYSIECKRLALLYAHLLNAVSENVRPKLAMAYTLFIRSVSELKENYEVINNDPELKHQVKFRHPVLLATSLAFRQRLSSIIQNVSEWDYAFAITEQGKMLIPQDEYLQQAVWHNKFIIIQADYNADRNSAESFYSRYREKVNKEENKENDRQSTVNENDAKLQKNSEINLEEEMVNSRHHIHHLPWWLHNEHLILFVKRVKGKTDENVIWKPVCGFFNPSNLLRDVVTPLFVGKFYNYTEANNSGQLINSDTIDSRRLEDANELARIFVAYYLKAVFWEAQTEINYLKEQGKDLKTAPKEQSRLLADKLNILINVQIKKKEKNTGDKTDDDKNQTKPSEEHYFMNLNKDQVEAAYELFCQGKLILGWEKVSSDKVRSENT